VQRYVRQFDPTFVGLTGTPAQIEEVKRAWKVAAYPDGGVGSDVEGGHGGHTVVHSPPVFVVDRDGMLKLVYTSGATSDAMAPDIERLL
jgi:protein SCO1/2